MASLTTLTVACAAQSEEAGSSSTQAVTSTNATDAGGDAGTTSECDDTLKAAFPGEDRYQWEPVKESKEVVACCNDEMKNGALSAHRWACCVSYDKLDSDGNPDTVAREHGMACTPWGPPVPPSMKRARKASRRDMNLALATHFGLVA